MSGRKFPEHLYQVPDFRDIFSVATRIERENDYDGTSSMFEREMLALKQIVGHMVDLMTDQQRYDLMVRLNGSSTSVDYVQYVPFVKKDS